MYRALSVGTRRRNQPKARRKKTKKSTFCEAAALGRRTPRAADASMGGLLAVGVRRVCG